MISGLTSKLSEEMISLTSTISPKTDVIRVIGTGTTTVMTTITPSFGGFSGILVVINDSGGNITTDTTGNIATARTIPQNMPVLFIYSKSANLWYPGAIS